MTPLLLALTLSAPGFAGDIPADASVAVRLELGALANDAESMATEVGELLDAWPPVDKLVEGTVGIWKGTVEEVQKAAGADLRAKRAVLTAVIDLDAKGGPVYAFVLRGTGAHAPAEPPEGSFTIDEHPAYHVPERDLVWAMLDAKTLIVGNERGVQRQLRHMKDRQPAKGDLQVVAARLRKAAPVEIAFSLSTAARTFVAETFPTGGALLAPVGSGSQQGYGNHVELRFDADSEKERDAIEHGVRAGGAFLNAGVALLEGGAEAVLGLDAIGKRPPQVPAALDAPTLKGFVADWLAGARFDLSVRHRKPLGVEATIKAPGPRPLVAAFLLLGVVALPSRDGGPGQAEAQVMLMALRQAQVAYKESKGEYLTCGPVPRELPTGHVDWPKQSCFDTIGFRPPGKVRFQVAAAVEDGTLVMMARGDADGDGVPEVWLLDEKSPAVERFQPPVPRSKEP